MRAIPVVAAVSVLCVACMGDRNIAVPVHSWAVSAGGLLHDSGNRIAVESTGNYLVAGTFTENAHFGNTKLTSEGRKDIFVAKVSPFGEFLWAMSVGGRGDDFIDGIAVDLKGRVRITGHFTGTAMFGSSILVSTGATDIFVAVIDSSGKILWATSAGGKKVDVGEGIAVDIQGNSYVTGTFDSIASFGKYTLVSAGQRDVFVAKIDNAGKYVWAQSAGGKWRDWVSDISVGRDGTCAITGSYLERAVFGNVIVTSNRVEPAIYISKIDTTGKVIWVTSSVNRSGWSGGLGMRTDYTGADYVLGEFEGTIQLGSFVLASKSKPMLLLAGLDSNGKFKWATTAGSGHNETSKHGFDIDREGNSYLVGEYRGTVRFGPSTLSHQSIYPRIFIAKANPAGNFLWGIEGGSTKNWVAEDIAVDSTENCIITGWFGEVTSFGPTYLASKGLTDAFIWKLEDNGY